MTHDQVTQYLRAEPMKELSMSKLQTLQQQAQHITDTIIAPRSAKVDETCEWPADGMKALAESGLTGLQVPERFGGHGEGLTGLSVITETIAQACPSTALCFGMHCVGSAVIAAKATDLHIEEYLRPIAEGRHITTLALSESGTGSHFYLPSTRLKENGDHLLVNGTKQFVTNGAHADSYVLSVVETGNDYEAGDFSCLILDNNIEGIEWEQPWHGFGMRGNSSRGLKLQDIKIRRENLLGERGDQVWYVFEVVAPFFLMAMAGTYLGIAEGAFQIARAHLKERRYAHSGQCLAEFDVPQTRLANMWINVQKTRTLIREAARLGDSGHVDALPYILACKADAGDTAVQVVNEAMTLCGGSAYRENSRLAQMLRDARASHVMSPTTDLLKLWTARSLLDVPLL